MRSCVPRWTTICVAVFHGGGCPTPALEPAKRIEPGGITLYTAFLGLPLPPLIMSSKRGGVRLIALLAIGTAAGAVVTLVALGGPGRSLRPALDQISRTRDARIRQLQLEREEGDAYDTAAQERSDGEDEQQGGIESVHWGPGWGPSMDKAFGSQVVDQSALDAFKFDRDIADDQAKASTYEKEVRNLNREADADERAAEQEQSRVAPQHRRKLGTTKAVRKAAARSARKIESSVQHKRASQGKLRRFPF